MYNNIKEYERIQELYKPTNQKKGITIPLCCCAKIFCIFFKILSVHHYNIMKFIDQIFALLYNM